MTKSIFILIAAAVFSAGTPALAQKTSPADDAQNKPQKIRPEPDRAFTDWIRDVEPILSADEAQARKKLRTNEERERFIEEFWHRLSKYSRPRGCEY